MPELGLYLSGFGLKQGLVLSDYTLTHISGEHRTIERFTRYDYPLQLTFSPNNSHAQPQALLNAFKLYTKGTKVLDSRYGNPYKCDIGNPHIHRVLPDGRVTIVTTGHSYRLA
jgi:hypothetical protein